MKQVKLTNKEIEIIIVWLNTYEPYPEDSKKIIEQEKKIIENIIKKLR